MSKSHQSTLAILSELSDSLLLFLWRLDYDPFTLTCSAMGAATDGAATTLIRGLGAVELLKLAPSFPSLALLPFGDFNVRGNRYSSGSSSSLFLNASRQYYST